jgi:hypothetical protein
VRDFSEREPPGFRYDSSMQPASSYRGKRVRTPVGPMAALLALVVAAGFAYGSAQAARQRPVDPCSALQTQGIGTAWTDWTEWRDAPLGRLEVTRPTAEGNELLRNDRASDALERRIVGFAERVVTGAYFDLRKLATPDVAKRRLLDAELHVAYARIDRITLRDPAAACTELQRARVALDAALRVASPRDVLLAWLLDDKLQALLAGMAITNGSAINAERLRYELSASYLQQLANDV